VFSPAPLRRVWGVHGRYLGEGCGGNAFR
jgi:hypothetical protein